MVIIGSLRVRVIISQMDRVLSDHINNLPQTAGVYFFKNAQEAVIYVGKAKNLKKRVKNHFQKPDQHAFDFISQITGIDFILTDTENAALLLEQKFIKQLQPRWNTEWKDDKNYASIAITQEIFPRIYITHQPKNEGEQYFGPFVKGKELKDFLREIRKAVPYRTCRNLTKKPCFYQSLDLCAAPCVYKRRKLAYVKMIGILNSLIGVHLGRATRIECYDISNLAGTLTVGSMAVFKNGKPDKNEYRKFKIKTVEGQNDVAALKEVLSRRVKHAEWPLPDLIVLDGGKGQLKAARGIKIPTVALAKIGDKDGKLFSPFSKNYAQLSRLPKNIASLLLQIRDEAHRFAIGYNRQRREGLIK